MRVDVVDSLLCLAYVEGVVSTRNAYERHVANMPMISDGTVYRFHIEQLAKAVTPFEKSLTVGSLLKTTRADLGVRSQEIAGKLGVSVNVYRLMEHDRISPLKVRPQVWKKLNLLFRISTKELLDIVTRTHQLVFFQHLFGTTLGRYRKHGRNRKSGHLERAASELFSRALPSLPGNEREKLVKFLKQIQSLSPGGHQEN